MQRYGQKTSKIPPRFFFKNRALSLLYPYGTTSCKKLEKNNERSQRYLKTDQQTDGPQTKDGQTRVITKDPLGRTQGPKLVLFSKQHKVECSMDSSVNHGLASNLSINPFQLCVEMHIIYNLSECDMISQILVNEWLIE